MNNRSLDESANVVHSTLLFSAGLLGNIIALCILYQHKRSSRRSQVSVFYILVTGLVLTDLLGKIIISSMVFDCYAKNTKLEGSMCQTFGLLMAFFGLCSMLILLAMALECWLSIGHPYFYQRNVTKKKAMIIFPVIGLLTLLFCSLPLLKFGIYRNYPPGTWCFIRMTRNEKKDIVFSLLYATLMGLLILSNVICNISAIVNLQKMYQRSLRNCTLNNFVESAANQNTYPCDEIDNMILLGLMTILLIICSTPLTVRAYIGAFAPDGNEEKDLVALRFHSINSIVDPWVFIIFRTSPFRALLRRLYNKLIHKKAAASARNTVNVLSYGNNSSVDQPPSSETGRVT
uniref:Prostaglandin D2 receptor n=1 Tax=Erpetoichthys calabaricus TaxID=27687 RepID=A0A8C4SPG4_ERPCA